jgi:exodeoxyribonuclease V alpha subunit
MDDGSLSLPDGSSAVILHTEGFNKASCYILAKWLFEKWGFEAGVYSNGKRGHFFLRLTCASSCAFWKLIAPWVHPSMAYKIPRGVLIGHSLGQLSSNFVEVSGYSVRSISKYTPKENSRKSVYDIEVEGNHNYFSNGVLVSNSMVDQELFFRTLDALEEGTILVLVGDDAQLPSVGPGNVLRELVRCPSIPTVRLTQIFRQAQKSEIILNSHRINHGDSIKPGDDSSDFRFVSILDDTKILELIVQMAKKLKSRDENFQVLSPKHEGVVGVINLNDKLREVLNPPAPGKKELTIGTLRFREGDRLMVIKNDYSLGIYNGDMGKLITIRSETLTVRIHGIGEGGIDVHVEVPRKEILQKLRLAYAITVHKSQGSEFDTVILPMVRNHGRMLQRNLFYTAVTRAKKKVWLLGDRGSIQKAINNDHVIHRNTGFGKSILELMQGAT